MNKEEEKRFLELMNTEAFKIKLAKMKKELNEENRKKEEEIKNRKPEKKVRKPFEISENVKSKWSEEFKENFEGYWRERDNFFEEYKGKWIAFSGNRVYGVGNTMDEAHNDCIKNGAKTMYIDHVGFEDDGYKC